MARRAAKLPWERPPARAAVHEEACRWRNRTRPDGETAWNADLWSAQRAEGPRATARSSPWATEVRERPLRPVAPHPADRRSKPNAPPWVSSVTTCAARTAARAGLKTGVPSRRRHQGAWPIRRTAFQSNLAKTGAPLPVPPSWGGGPYGQIEPAASSSANRSAGQTSIPSSVRNDRRPPYTRSRRVSPGSPSTARSPRSMPVW